MFTMLSKFYLVKIAVFKIIVVSDLTLDTDVVYVSCHGVKGGHSYRFVMSDSAF